MDVEDLIALRIRIRDGLAGNRHYRCSSCGVGIEPDRVTYYISPIDAKVFCASCASDIEESMG